MSISTNKKLTRAFVCIDFSDSVIKEIARVDNLILKKIFTGKLTELGNLHLTLKFLGEIDDDMIVKVKDRLSEIDLDELELKTGYLGTFTRRGNPNLVWLKIEGKSLWELQKLVDNSLKDLFKSEEKFMGHVTLARVKYVKDKKGFEEYIKQIRVRAVNFKIKSFKLKSSDLGKTGPTYRTIEEYKLN